MGTKVWSTTFWCGAPRAGPASVQDTAAVLPEVVRGAFESFEAGRACEVSSACHWATNMAASGSHGRMYGKAYAVTPSGIYVPPELLVRRPEDLAGVEIAVGYHSGSHFSTLQALEPFLTPEQVNLRFTGLPLDRLTALLDLYCASGRGVRGATVRAGAAGFSEVVDTTFMIGFIVEGGRDRGGRGRVYFRALGNERSVTSTCGEPEALQALSAARTCQSRSFIRWWTCGPAGLGAAGVRAVHAGDVRADAPLDGKAAVVPRRPGGQRELPAVGAGVGGVT